MYTSKIAVVELSKQLVYGQKICVHMWQMSAPKELSIICCFVEHFLEIVPNVKTIYSALIKFMKDKNIHLVGVGFNRAATFFWETIVCRVTEEEITSCCVCTLPLPLASTCLITYIMHTCTVCHTHHPLEIFPLLSQVS